MTIAKIIEFDAGHRIPSHKGKCFNLHGHRYKVEFVFDGEMNVERGSSGQGMILDFGIISQQLKGWIDNNFDHRCLIHEDDPWRLSLEQMEIGVVSVDFVPTAENLAEFFLGLANDLLKTDRVACVKVRVYETPTCWAEVEK